MIIEQKQNKVLQNNYGKSSLKVAFDIHHNMVRNNNYIPIISIIII